MTGPVVPAQIDAGLVWLVGWSLHPQRQCVKCRECANTAAATAYRKGHEAGHYSMRGSAASTLVAMDGTPVRHLRETHDHGARVTRIAAANVVILPTVGEAP